MVKIDGFDRNLSIYLGKFYLSCSGVKVKSKAKTRNFPIYYEITFHCGIFMTIILDMYTQVAIYRLSPCIGVHMVRAKCEKYSLESEIWAKT